MGEVLGAHPIVGLLGVFGLIEETPDLVVEVRLGGVEAMATGDRKRALRGVLITIGKALSVGDFA